VLTPEVTEGPYYLDIDKVRSDITEGKDGTPLDLRITVVDASGCTPIRDAAVDVWHCDAGGVYSGFSQAGGGPGGPGASQSTTDNQTFLRGTQVSDGNGLAEFRTIYPGWYRGRAVHIHMKVHVGGSVVHTGQLFFDDGLTEQVYRNAPYNSRGNPDVRNSADSIYRDAGAASAVPTMTPSGNGYAGAITVGVKRT
jgi:protocatechuate 3,4-dioxygenase beta subunit